jgi:hypothetical protein
MFTAIALVAFCEASMANNKIAIKKNVIYYKTEKKSSSFKKKLCIIRISHDICT